MTHDDAGKTVWLDFIIAMTVLVIVVVHATSWAFPLGWLGELLGLDADTVKKAPHLAPADVLIWIAGALLLVRIILRRDLRVLKRLPVAGVLLTVLAVLSMRFAANKLTAVADVIQFVDYFVVLMLLFTVILTTRDRVQLVVMLWLAVGSIVAVWALVHYLDPDRGALDVSGPFLNRNVLGGYLAMLLPFAWGLMLHSRKPAAIAQSAVLVGVGLVVMLAGGPWLAAMLGILVVSTVRSAKLLPAALAALLILWLFILPALPRDNARTLVASVYAYDKTQTIDERRYSKRYIRWQACVRFLAPSYIVQDGDVYHSSLTMTRSKHVRYLLLGYGIGNYEAGLDEFFADLPKPNVNMTEPDTQNLYLVLAFSVGLPAALAFLWLVGAHMRRAAVGYRKTSDPLLRGVLLGCLGALVGCLVANVFTETLVRGSGPAMILVLALAA